MTTVNDAMRLIKVLDPNASLHFSDHTDEWYISTHHVEIRDGVLVSGILERRPTPGQAVRAFLARCQDIREPETLLLGPCTPQPREVRWNGAAWAPVGAAS